MLEEKEDLVITKRVLKNGVMDALSQPVEHKIKEEN